MTTIQFPYGCGMCKNQFDVTMKLGEPIISKACPKCGGIANALDSV